MSDPLHGDIPKPDCQLVLATNNASAEDHVIDRTLRDLARMCYAGYRGFRAPKK